MNVDRRQALQAMLGGTAGGVALLTPAEAAASPIDDRDALGMLYDATRCTGCKACVTACTAANDLVPDTVLSNGRWQMPTDLNAQTKNIIKLYEAPDSPTHSFVKRQCMHCVEPACVTGCPFGALTKRPEDGVVAWHASLCIGCRYCEIACPFEVPKFDWANFNPQVVKCELCRHRFAEGGGPACTEVCPTGAVIAGNRADLLADAKRRIAAHPGQYFEDRVYGEHEAGGTQVLYLSHVSFAALGLPTLSDESLAHYGTKVHHVLYRYLAIPLALWALMAGIIRSRFKHHEKKARVEEASTGLPPQL